MLRTAGRAEEAEGEHFGGKKVWKCIRDMQHGHRGLRPSRVVSIEDEDGVSCDHGHTAPTLEEAL